MNILYKIYYDELVYIGRTKQKLQDRLRGHFFGKPLHQKIAIKQVTKIEYAQCKTVADMYLYEIYYINTLYPLLNIDDRASDELTIQLPDLDFEPFDCHLMDKWKKQMELLNQKAMEKRQRGIESGKQKRKARRELSCEDYTIWLKHFEEENQEKAG